MSEQKPPENTQEQAAPEVTQEPMQESQEKKPENSEVSDPIDQAHTGILNLLDGMGLKLTHSKTLTEDQCEIIDLLWKILDKRDEVKKLRKNLSNRSMEALENLANEVEGEEDFKKFLDQARSVGKDLIEYEKQYDELKSMALELMRKLKP